ncbi:MAB_1171c family putative transporter [Mycobacteroides abscessus]|uniref:MAB_1171c family putative transporter n=1 Tax=Mycobacteroides abscessus TaxID=36809 RepID=UPI0009A7D5B9|nr:MAB_1171c family putative transporter [Mycobacteroides abscessus]RIT41392.1 hypothetical protein D2E80_23800 [Mycobacteroides abscessus]SKT62914.1 Uncharacterised protein [Mycobacteroides abscessus subsp. massiliense]SKU17726.1 Uncharacterised protein [Mycobacteroides abscessus subsp. massiliense]
MAIIVRCRHYLTISRDALFRRGLLLTITGAGVYLVFCAVRGAVMLGVALGENIGSWEALSTTLAGLGAGLIAAGLTIPIWAPQLTRLADAVARYLEFRRLGPLWSDLYRDNRAIAMFPPGAMIGGPGFLLYRRIVEIRDGLLAVRRYAPEFLGHDPTSELAQVAGEIWHAIHASRDAQTPQTNTLPSAQIRWIPELPRAREVSWLIAVGTEYAKLAQIRRSAPPAPEALEFPPAEANDARTSTDRVG